MLGLCDLAEHSKKPINAFLFRFNFSLHFFSSFQPIRWRFIGYFFSDIQHYWDIWSCFSLTISCFRQRPAWPNFDFIQKYNKNAEKYYDWMCSRICFTQNGSRQLEQIHFVFSPLLLRPQGRRRQCLRRSFFVLSWPGMTDWRAPGHFEISCNIEGSEGLLKFGPNSTSSSASFLWNSQCS